MNPTQNDSLNINPLTLSNQPTEAQSVETVRSETGQETTLGARGSSGTYIYSGIITREEYNNELIRFKALENYDIMRRSDATVRAALKVCKQPLLSATWHIESAGDEQQDTDIAEFIRQQLFEQMPFTDRLNEITSYMEFGYSVFEKVLAYVDFTPPPIQPPKPEPEPPKPDANGVLQPVDEPEAPDPILRPDQRMIGLADLASRKQRSIYRWETNPEDGEPQLGITQYVPGGTYSVPWENLCVFSFDREGDNYEGISMLRAAYKHWKMKDTLELIDAIRHERQGLGIIEIIPPAGANQTDVEDTISAARHARASEEAVIKHPEGWTVQFMDMKGGSATVTDIGASLEYHKREISKSVLAQFLELGGGSKGASGSRAVSKDHSDLFEMALEHIAKYISSVINRDLIKPLVDLNFTGVKNYPTLEHSKIGDDDIASISAAVSSLMAAKALTPDPDLEQSLRNMMHLPDLPDDIREHYDERDPVATPPTDDSGQIDDNVTTPDAEDSEDLAKTASDNLAQFLSARSNLHKEYIDGLRIGS